MLQWKDPGKSLVFSQTKNHYLNKRSNIQYNEKGEKKEK